MHRFFLAALIVAAVPAAAATNSLALSRSQLDQLSSLQPGSSIVLDGFPDGRGSATSVRFERVEIYAPGARVMVVDASGEHEVPRSQRIHLLGADAHGTLRASLAFDPGFEHVTGVASTASGTFAIGAQRDDLGAHVQVVAMEETLPPGVVPEMIAGDDALPSGDAAPSALAIAVAAAAPATPRGAVVAIDTDTQFMTKRFGGNASAATSWIADLFAAMNVMYQRDLNVTLQQGTTYLRTATDPYSVTDSPADGTNLSEFGNYWQANYTAISRSFAALLSGKSSSGNSASGIAWINSYCHSSSQGGSYSVTQVFTNPQLGISYSALIVGHELGHNFGAAHTHCTDVNTGAYNVATNTIDKCYSTESNCYSGASSCPTSGPGAPAGTVMSYCNIKSCGSGSQNVLQFHPAQLPPLVALVAQNTPSCLSANEDLLFRNGFE